MTTLTYEEYQSMCYSHMHEDINVDDVLNSIQVLQPVYNGKLIKPAIDCTEEDELMF